MKYLNPKQWIWSIRTAFKKLKETKIVTMIRKVVGWFIKGILFLLQWVVWFPVSLLIKYVLWEIYRAIISVLKYVIGYPIKYLYRFLKPHVFRHIANFFKATIVKTKEIISEITNFLDTLKPFYIDGNGNSYLVKQKLWRWPIYIVLIVFGIVLRIIKAVFTIVRLIYDAIKRFVLSISRFIVKLDKFEEIETSAVHFVQDVRLNKGRMAQGFLYLSPALILMAIFTFWPIINSFRLIMFSGYKQSDGSYLDVGLQYAWKNLTQVVKEPGFIIGGLGGSSAFLNTLIVTVFSVGISMILALAIAVALNSIKIFRKFFETIYFLPYVTNTIALGLVFAFLFGGTGLVNKAFGLGTLSWVEQGATYFRAMFVLVLYSVWNGLAFKIMVFSSSIQGIDKMYYDAAAIDATPKGRVFTKITVPLISPMIMYLLITSVIGGFKTYSSVVALFGVNGRPEGTLFNLKTIVFYIYDYLQNTNPGQLSLAAAASIVLFIFMMFLTMIQMHISSKRVHY